MNMAVCADKIREKLNTEFVGRNIIVYDKTDSTNTRAKEMRDEAEGTVFIAESQSCGKGSKGREWVSESGTGIWMSILLKPQIDIVCVPQITLVAGMALKRVLGDKAQIKWPNDVVLGTKKVCGILTEMSVMNGKTEAVVCGIGVNVNQRSFPAEILHRATSLFLENKHEYDRNLIVAEIVNEFESLYKIFVREGLSPLLSEYKSSCVTLNREINVIYDNKTITGTAVNIDLGGALVVQTQDGLAHINSGEVSVRGIYEYV